jgi:hypothetical protein
MDTLPTVFDLSKSTAKVSPNEKDVPLKLALDVAVSVKVGLALQLAPE